MSVNYYGTIALTGEQCRGEGLSLITRYSHRHMRANSTHARSQSGNLSWFSFVRCFWIYKREGFIVAWLIIKVLHLQDVIIGQRRSQRSHFMSVKEKLIIPLGKSEVTFAFFLIKCF